jgi:outer membrane lipoprotein-sorting protein
MKVMRAAVLVVVAIVASGSLADVAASQDTDAAASDLLERVAGANNASYRARQVVVSFGGKQAAAVLDVTSSADGRFVRAARGNEVTRLWTTPDMGVVDGEYTSKHEGHLAQVEISPRSVLQKYEVDVGQPEEMLGVELVPVTLVRRADYRIGERWWIHPKSGVIYRRELFDARGELAGLATLIEMEWGDPGPAEPVAAESEAATSAVAIDVAGAPKRLAGGYRFWRAYRIPIGERAAEHLVYTDGLHALSVFRLPGGLAVPEGFESSRVQGVFRGPGLGTWAWEGDGSSYVAVAEEPALDASELVRSFPLGGPSFWERLGSVWSRLFRGLGSLFD